MTFPLLLLAFPMIAMTIAAPAREHRPCVVNPDAASDLAALHDRRAIYHASVRVKNPDPASALLIESLEKSCGVTPEMIAQALK